MRFVECTERMCTHRVYTCNMRHIHMLHCPIQCPNLCHGHVHRSHVTHAHTQAVVVFLDRNAAHFPDSLPENILPAKAAGKLMRNLEKVTSGAGTHLKEIDENGVGAHGLVRR